MSRVLPLFQSIAKDWTAKSIFYGGRFGMAGGLAAGFWAAKEDGYWNDKTKDRILQRTMYGMCGVIAGGVVGATASFLLPFWFPVLTTAALYEVATKK